MANLSWRLKGEWIKNCNCAYGCPCDFNARPTYGNCDGIVVMNIQQGHFGDVRLDGLKFALMARWPGALHEGNGTAQIVIDERAAPTQGDALVAILSGKHAKEGTLFHIFSLIVTKIHEPKFAPFEWSFDLEGRTARVRVPGFLETMVEPIRNPVTGAPHRIQVMMPEGFEHRGAEVAAARIDVSGAINFKVPSGHSSLALVDHTPTGVA